MNQLFWEDVAEGYRFSVPLMHVSYRHLINHVGAGRDYMRGHHDPTYAHEQGQRDIYPNTLFHQSMVDRVMTDWAGPRSFIARRKIAMRGSIYPGDDLRGEAEVVKRHVDAHGRHRVELRIALVTQAALVCEAEGSLALPSRATA